MIKTENKQKELVIELLLEPNVFQGWLQKQCRSSVIGISGNPEHCPLANFLDQSGVRTQVHPDEICIYNPNDKYFVAAVINIEEVGDWVEEFIYYIDKQCSEYMSADDALEALSYLENIC